MSRHGPRLAALVVLVCLAFASAWSPREARAELPTLERSIELARARSLVVVGAEAEIGVANAQMTGARVSAIGNPYSDIQVDQGLNSGQQLQALSYTYVPVDIWGQRGARIEEADRLLQWRRLGLVDARAIATGDATAAYGQLVVSSARVRLASAGETHARDEAKYFAGRFEAKDTTLYEKSLADAEVARWVQTRAEGELSVTNARVRFAQLIGAPAEGSMPAETRLSPPALRGAWDDAHVVKVVERSPLLVRLAAEREYWDASAERYRTERVPPIALEVIAGRGAQGEARLGGGIVLTFPFTRRYQGEIARAEFGRDHVQRTFGLYRNMVETRVRAARDALLTISRTVAELDKDGLPALEQAVAAAQEGYRAGKIELTRVLLARRDLALAKGRRLDLLDAAWRAYADLAILSGELP